MASIYYTDGSPGNVAAYTISASTGALTSIGSVAVGSHPASVTVDPSGKFAYVATGESYVAAYTIDPDSGALTSIGSVAAGQLRARSSLREGPRVVTEQKIGF